MTKDELTKIFEEKIVETLKDNVWGLVCECGGGGSDYENGKETCGKCNGTGIFNWHFELGVEKILNLFDTYSKQKALEWVNLERKSVTELLPLMGESYKDLSTQVSYKEGFNRALREIRNRIGEGNDK